MVVAECRDDAPRRCTATMASSSTPNATWQRLDLHMAKEHGGSLWITLLRPAWWVESKGAQVGGTIEL
ncbi:MAG: hypothetical protein DWQ31_09490, partial [Planctomycetota bacterium]